MDYKNVLLIIDPQHDFIDGSLAVKDADKFVENLCEFIKIEGKSYDVFVITQDWHPDTHCSFADNGGEWPAHCVEETKGASIPETIVKALQDTGKPTVFLTKGTNEDMEEYSIFKNDKSSTVLKEILDDSEQICVCGIAYDYCVKDTIKDAIKQGYKNKMTILSNLCPCIGDASEVDAWLDDEGIPMIH